MRTADGSVHPEPARNTTSFRARARAACGAASDGQGLTMTDWIMIGVTLGFFGLTLAYIHACDHL